MDEPLLKEKYIKVEKNFEELTTTELYELLKVRSEIFVVEQNCIYQDMDDKDYYSRHLFYIDSNNQIKAALRLFNQIENPDVVQIGRVLTRERKIGLGRILLHEGVEIAKKKMNAKRIYLEAQEYAIGFYAKEGFKVSSGIFLEDGIPHVKMYLDVE